LRCRRKRFGVAPRAEEEFGANKFVVQNDVGPPASLQGAQCQNIRIARPAPDEMHVPVPAWPEGVLSMAC